MPTCLLFAYSLKLLPATANAAEGKKRFAIVVSTVNDLEMKSTTKKMNKKNETNGAILLFVFDKICCGASKTTCRFI